MPQSKISIKQISYKNPNDDRIMKSCLKNWFRNPKELNFTSPGTGYPFNYNHWKKKYYHLSDVESYVLKCDNWIIGHMSLIHRKQNNKIHLFHLFIDPDYRQQGYATQLMNFAENLVRKQQAAIFSLNVVAKNTLAIEMYKKLGFEEMDTTANRSIYMEKILVT